MTFGTTSWTGSDVRNLTQEWVVISTAALEGVHFWDRSHVEENLMTPQELRTLARKCRKWAKSSIDPDNIALFKIWATDLAEEADETECDNEYKSHYRPRSFSVREEQ